MTSLWLLLLLAGKLYEKIVVGEYEVPSWMGDDVHDLVASMLVLDPDRRATLEEIAEVNCLLPCVWKSRVAGWEGVGGGFREGSQSPPRQM